MLDSSPPSFFLPFFSFRPDIGIEEFEEKKVNFDERVDADEKLVPNGYEDENRNGEGYYQFM